MPGTKIKNRELAEIIYLYNQGKPFYEIREITGRSETAIRNGIDRVAIDRELRNEVDSILHRVADEKYPFSYFHVDHLNKIASEYTTMTNLADLAAERQLPLRFLTEHRIEFLKRWADGTYQKHGMARLEPTEKPQYAVCGSCGQRIELKGEYLVDHTWPDDSELMCMGSGDGPLQPGDNESRLVTAICGYCKQRAQIVDGRLAEHRWLDDPEVSCMGTGHRATSESGQLDPDRPLTPSELRRVGQLFGDGHHPKRIAAKISISEARVNALLNDNGRITQEPVEPVESDLRQQVAALRAELAELRKETAEPPVGTILILERVLDDRPGYLAETLAKRYTFVYFHAPDGLWYSTGRNEHPSDWLTIRERMKNRRTREVRIVTGTAAY